MLCPVCTDVLPSLHFCLRAGRVRVWVYEQILQGRASGRDLPIEVGEVNTPLVITEWRKCMRTENSCSGSRQWSESLRRDRRGRNGCPTRLLKVEWGKEAADPNVIMTWGCVVWVSLGSCARAEEMTLPGEMQQCIWLTINCGHHQ